MPTDVISKIGATNSPTTMDYSTLQAWEDASPADLVSADERWIGECYDQGTFTANLTISGETVDSTRYIILRCATGASFKDKAGVRTTALLFNTANGAAISQSANSAIFANTSYSRIDGLMVKRTTYTDGIVNSAGGVDHLTVSNCIVGKGSNTQMGYSLRDPTSRVINSLTVGAGISGQCEVYGCTVIGPGSGTGLASTYANMLVKNTAVFGFTTLFSGGGFRTGSDYNATDLATAWGTGAHNLNSLTFANQFVDSTNDFRAVVTGDLKAGTPDSTNTPTDITGVTRDATTPYIGCWEVAGGAGTFTASAGLTIKGMTLAAAATFAPGTHTAGGSLTIKGMTLASSDTFSSGTETASGSLAIKGSTLAAACTFASGTHTAAGALSIKGATLSAAATFGAGTHTATGALTIKGPTLAGSVTFAAGTHTASGALSIKGATLAAVATFTPPAGFFTATAALSIKGATLSGSATYRSLSRATADLVLGGVMLEAHELSAVVPITDVGIQWTLAPSLMHYTLAPSHMHYTLPKEGRS